MPVLDPVSERRLRRLITRREPVTVPDAGVAKALSAAARRRFLRTTRTTLADGRVKVYPAGER